MNRVLVVGSPGSGKTTLAAALAERLKATHVELDALFWEPNWVQAETQVFRARALAATEGERWVACGNYYSKLKDLLWTRADTIVWLDLPTPLILWRIVRRTVRRSRTRMELWSGNVERLSSLWREDSLLKWALESKPKHAQRYGAVGSDPRWAHITFIRLRSPREVRSWLARVPATPGPT